MNYRSLGATGIRISEIGFGSWGIGGTAHGSISYGETDDAASASALLAAVEHGITFFDTSNFYGYGHSEELIGQTLSRFRSQIVLCTKAGFIDAQRQNFDSAYIRGCLEDSLRRLRTDYADVFLLHSPRPEDLRGNAPLLDLLARWKRDGVVRSWGISARSPSEALSMLGEFAPDCLQVNFNLVDLRAVECGLWKACREQNTGIIARTPLAFGFLSGQIPPEQTFNANDHRSRFSLKQRQLWANSVPLYQQVFKKGAASSSTQNALRFCLSFPEVSTVIPGMLHRREVEENVLASKIGPLDSAQIDEIVSLSIKHGFFR